MLRTVVLLMSMFTIELVYKAPLAKIDARVVIAALYRYNVAHEQR